MVTNDSHWIKAAGAPNLNEVLAGLAATFTVYDHKQPTKQGSVFTYGR